MQKNRPERKRKSVNVSESKPRNRSSESDKRPKKLKPLLLAREKKRSRHRESSRKPKLGKRMKLEFRNLPRSPKESALRLKKPKPELSRSARSRSLPRRRRPDSRRRLPPLLRPSASVLRRKRESVLKLRKKPSDLELRRKKQQKDVESKKSRLKPSA